MVRLLHGIQAGIQTDTMHSKWTRLVTSLSGRTFAGRFIIVVIPLYMGYALIGVFSFSEQDDFNNLWRALRTLFALLNGDSILLLYQEVCPSDRSEGECPAMHTAVLVAEQLWCIPLTFRMPRRCTIQPVVVRRAPRFAKGSARQHSIDADAW